MKKYKLSDGILDVAPVKSRNWARLLIYLLLLIVAIGQLFPLIWLLDFSLAKDGELFGPKILIWPSNPQFENYKVAWVDGKIPQYLFNSIIVNVISVSLTVLFSVMMSYAFTRMQWKLKNFCLTIVLLGMMIPIHATLLPNFSSFRVLGISDSFLGLIIPYIGITLPMGTFLMTGFIKSIPVSIEESILIDGGGIFHLIIHAIFPLAKPAVITVVIMTFFTTWNDFIMAATYLASDKYRTLPFAVYNFAGQYASRYAVQFAVMTLVALPSLILYMILNEQITKGITIGAIKG
ncbi:MAG TPA: sugar ABC transporter permease [Firmicutes bacterium]|jgi:raffinose/stachyose/melibiose transport system permease protein|nr:sugar ABC transporter permease [Bacillota bacterium]HBT18215.1 sugar ABC transporter permease [Bacillota bacterium]